MRYGIVCKKAGKNIHILTKYNINKDVKRKKQHEFA